MTSVWDVFLENWSRSVIESGWKSWSGHVLLPLLVMILLSNLSVMRVLLDLQRKPASDTRVPRFSGLLAAPVLLCGISCLVTLFATRHSSTRPLADALQTLTALLWIIVAFRLSMVLTRMTAPRPGAVRIFERERKAEALASSVSVPRSHSPPQPTVSGS